MDSQLISVVAKTVEHVTFRLYDPSRCPAEAVRQVHLTPPHHSTVRRLQRLQDFDCLRRLATTCDDRHRQTTAYPRQNSILASIRTYLRPHLSSLPAFQVAPGDDPPSIMFLETITLDHLPSSHKIHAVLFRDVKNAPFLHQQLLARNADFEYAFVDASVIADAYRRYGISPSTKDLIVVKVTFPAEDGTPPIDSERIWEHLKTNVEGEALALTDDHIFAATDLPKVRKYYKLNGLKWLEDIKDEKVKRKETETLVLGGMALRGV
ncbi:hypothetical protein AK830_g10619 [Neonectria ditissima]|uniref:EKC/KEOPS complex subunit CGI121 n=1 Tax=Neonectria ditissima TaxID=78410 RepID=A0A0P7B5P1_9HYPO|nr:hypothetical protein AK830_g10619 [Neonectria ditissima]